MLKPLALYDPLEHMSKWLVRLDGAGPTVLRLVFFLTMTKAAPGELVYPARVMMGVWGERKHGIMAQG